jgi:hypothetical protein
MKAKLFLGVAAVVLALGLPSASRADSCSITVNGVTITGNTVNLTNNNLGLTGVTIQLCVATSGGNTFVDVNNVTGTSSLTTGDFAFIQQIGVNGTATNIFVDAFAPTNPDTSLGWKQGPDGCTNQFDGFKGSTSCGLGGGGNSGSAVNGENYWEFSGTLSTSNTWDVHVAFNDCTGFFSSDTTTVTSSQAGQCNGVPLPEPGSFTLLGLGLAAVAGLALLRRVSA